MNESLSTTFNYSDTYRSKIEAAILEAERLALPNRTSISPRRAIEDARLKSLEEYLLNDFYAHLYQRLPAYWGDKCQTLSGLLYARLVTMGFDADIVVGEVEVNGTLEFDATLENIRHEYGSTKQEGNQSLHAWVTIGDDTVIDAGLPDRMINYYRFPEKYMPPIIVGRAGFIAKRFFAKHEPLLVGTDFIAKTNTVNPRDLLSMFNGKAASSC